MEEHTEHHEENSQKTEIEEIIHEEMQDDHRQQVGKVVIHNISQEEEIVEEVQEVCINVRQIHSEFGFKKSFKLLFTLFSSMKKKSKKWYRFIVFSLCQEPKTLAEQVHHAISQYQFLSYFLK